MRIAHIKKNAVKYRLQTLNIVGGVIAIVEWTNVYRIIDIYSALTVWHLNILQQCLSSRNMGDVSHSLYEISEFLAKKSCTKAVPWTPTFFVNDANRALQKKLCTLDSLLVIWVFVFFRNKTKRWRADEYSIYALNFVFIDKYICSIRNEKFSNIDLYISFSFAFGKNDAFSCMQNWNSDIQMSF